MSKPTFGKGSDLRDPITFPTFRNCPFENDVDERYFTPSFEGPFDFKRHWCFLGEIMQADALLRLVMAVRDLEGTMATIACYDDERGMQFASKAKPGSTVAIICGLTHGFIDGSDGFRVEDASSMRIFPHSLKTLQAANKEIHTERTLDACRVPGCTAKASLQACSGCRLVCYCGKEHQTKDWSAHKDMCKAAGALKFFTDRDWTVYKQQYSFK